MTLRSVQSTGSYFPAFFTLTLGYAVDLTSVNGTSSERALHHELIHFLQDASTTFGLINITRSVDALKDLNQILRSSGGTVTVPISASLRSPSVAVNRDLFSIYMGDSADKHTEFPSRIKVVALRASDEDVEGVSGPVKAIEIELGLEGSSTTASFYFGAMAILESMASLIECQLYGRESTLKSYPYDSARLIADRICVRAPLTDWAVAEICEASLMYYNPAELFVDALRTIEARCLRFTTPNKYYDFVLKSHSFDSGDVVDEYEVQLKVASSQLTDLFTVPPLSDERWAAAILASASRLRLSGYSLAARLESVPSNERPSRLIEIVRSIGFPVTFSAGGNVWTRTSDAQLRTPLFFPAIMAVYEVLEGKSASCRLSSTCTGSNGYCVVDEECHSRPWVRARQGKACYFSDIWKMWGLENISIGKISN